MLVLSRQRDETIMIGDEVEITIVDIRGDKVRLGINAPRNIQVHRKEVYDAITRENEDASQMTLDPASLPTSLQDLTPTPAKGEAPTQGLRTRLELTPTRIERTASRRIAQ